LEISEFVFPIKRKENPPARAKSDKMAKTIKIYTVLTVSSGDCVERKVNATIKIYAV
jgi:hypothetical protein